MSASADTWGVGGVFYALQLRGLERTATLYAGELADGLSSLIVEAPALWKNQAQKYVQILKDFTPRKDIALIHIRDEQGRPISAYEYKTPESERWWNRLTPAGSAPIVFNNHVLGAVEVHVSKIALLRASARVFFLLIGVGVGFAILMYWFPIIVVRRVEGRVQTLIGDLEQSSATLDRRAREAEELAKIARTLTERVDVETVGRRIVGSVQQILGVRSAVVWQLRSDGALVVVAASGLAEGVYPRGFVLPPGLGVVGQVASKGEPVYCPDVFSDPAITSYEQLQQIGAAGERAVLAVPLRARARMIGALSITDQAGRVFSESETTLLQVFADQAALALENARLYEETDRRRREAEELARVAQSLTESLDTTVLGEQIVTSVQALFNVKGAILRFFQPDGTLRTLASSGEFFSQSSGGDALSPGAGLTGLAIAEGRPIWSADVLNEPGIPLTDWMRDHQLRSGNRSMIVVPLRAHGRIIGSLGLSDRTGRVYPDGEVKLLQTFADHAAVALENAGLYDRAQRSKAEVERLYEMARETISTANFDEVLGEMLRSAAALLDCHGSSIRLLDPETNALRVVANYNVDEEFAGRGEIALGEGRTGRVVLEGVPATIEDVETDPLYVHREEALRAGIRSIALIPLRAHEASIGVLGLYDNRRRRFSEEKLSSLTKLGNLVTLAIEKNRLFEESERRRREAEELGRISRTLTESLDVSAVGERIVESVLPLFAAQGAVVWLIEPDSSMAVLASTGPAEDVLARGHVFPAGVGVPAKIVVEGRPVWFSDVLSEADILIPDDVRRRLADSETTAVLAVPLRVKGRTIGALVIRDRTGRVFSKDEVALLEAFASQGALALENARLYEVERTRQEQLDAVRKIGQEVSTELELEPLLHLIVRRAVELTGRNSGIVYTLEDQVVVPRAWWNLGPWLSEVRFPLGQGIPGIVAQTGQAMIVNDYLHSPYVHASFKEHSTVTALLAMPLISKGKVVGVITINNGQTNRSFSEADLAILSLFAPQAASAIENARLFKETERHLQQTAGLLSVTQTLSGSLDSQEIARRTARQLSRLLEADTSIFFEIDEASEVAPVAGYHVPQELRDPTYRMSLTDLPPSLLEAGSTGMPVACSNVATDPRFDHPVIRSMPIHPRSLLYVPLQSKGRFLGAFVSYWWDEAHLFIEEELELAAGIASQTALALENARLFEGTRRLVEELKTMARELQVKNKELDTFVYTVSHDLKAPLVTLQGMADLLVETCGKQFDEQGQHYVTRIKANAQQMEQLVLDLLALSRIGREGREPEAVGLDDVVDELLMMEWGERIRTRGVKVVRQALPVLWGVRTQLEQVMSNLVGNAIKYLGNTPAPVVEIGAKDGGGELVECYVKDNGIGIDPAYHEKVFEIFQRLKETQAEGTGVGLAIVKKIVEGAGGRIWIESAKGQGATFRFTWPRAEVAA